MQTYYDNWNKLKQIINYYKKPLFCNQREIWWCSIGMNIGTEVYGKNELFERPVIILKVYNKETALILPITSKEKLGKYYFKIRFGFTNSFAVLSQSRTINTRRLSRKIGRLPKSDFRILLNNYSNSLQNETPL